MKSRASKGDEGVKLIAANRRAFHDYFILEKLEVGIALHGSELRPIREGRVNLKDGFVDAEAGQFWLNDIHIGANPFSNRFDHEPTRRRRLLAHKREIAKWTEKVKTTGITIIPLRIYFRTGRVKLEIALVKGKAQYDKRETIAKRDLKREMDRELGGRGR